jgi:uncharacterized membrane protein
MKMDNIISIELMAGVLISAALISIGVIFLFLDGGSDGMSLAAIASGNSLVNSAGFGIPAIVNSAENFQGLGFIFIGLIALIATPVVRVVLSVFLFAEEKNWIYVAITMIVLFNLLLAIFIVPGMVSTKVVIPQ